MRRPSSVCSQPTSRTWGSDGRTLLKTDVRVGRGLVDDGVILEESRTSHRRHRTRGFGVYSDAPGRDAALVTTCSAVLIDS